MRRRFAEGSGHSDNAAAMVLCRLNDPELKARIMRSHATVAVIAFVTSYVTASDKSARPALVADAPDVGKAADTVKDYREWLKQADSHEPVSDLSVRLFMTWSRAASGVSLSSTKDARSRLIGEVEGIVGAQCPQAWIDLVYNLDAKLQHLKQFDKVDYFDCGSGVRSRSSNIRYNDGKVEFLSGTGHTIALDGWARFVKVAASIEGVVSADSAECMVALPSAVSSPYTTALYDIRSNKRLWTQTVWSMGITAASGFDHGFHYCFPVIARDRCVVFGASPYGVYIEGFEARTGKPVIRFHSDCWGKGIPAFERSDGPKK